MHSIQNVETCVFFVSTSTATQTARLQLVRTHQNILKQVTLDAEALSDLFALECHREATHIQVGGTGEETAMLVEGLNLSGAVVWEEVKTLGNAAVEEGLAVPCCTLRGF